MRGRKHTAAQVDLTDTKGKAKVVYVVHDGVNPPEEFCEDEEAVQRRRKDKRKGPGPGARGPAWGFERKGQQQTQNGDLYLDPLK